MIELTQEQRRVLESGDLRVRDPGTNATYILVREDLFSRMRSMLNDDTQLTTAEMLDAVMAEDDANDPMLAELQKKYQGRP